MEAEDIRKKFGELPSQTLAWSALFSISLVMFAIEAIETFVKGTSFVSSLLRAGVACSSGQIQIALWLLLFFSALMALPVLLGVLLFHAAAQHQLAQNRLRVEQESRKKAERCFTETMFAASVIRSRQTPNAAHTAKVLEQIDITYDVHADLSATITQRCKLYAAGPALNFWEISIQPSSDADEIQYLTDIQFKVSDKTDPNRTLPVTYLQTLNELRFKRVCIYFLPQLIQGDHPRIIEVSYTWPRYLLKLKKDGREELFQNFNSAGPTSRFTLNIWFADGCGGTSGLDVVSAYPHTLGVLSEAGRSGFQYVAKNLPAGRQEHKLSVTLRPN